MVVSKIMLHPLFLLIFQTLWLVSWIHLWQAEIGHWYYNLWGKIVFALCQCWVDCDTCGHQVVFLSNEVVIIVFVTLIFSLIEKALIGLDRHCCIGCPIICWIIWFKNVLKMRHGFILHVLLPSFVILFFWPWDLNFK